jgi:hypothetical protein
MNEIGSFFCVCPELVVHGVIYENATRMPFTTKIKHLRSLRGTQMRQIRTLKGTYARHILTAKLKLYQGVRQLDDKQENVLTEESPPDRFSEIFTLNRMM